MSEPKPQTDKPEAEKPKLLTLGAGGKLELKKPAENSAAAAAGGQVKQSFSHGRSKTVAVEVKRRRDVPAAPAHVAPQANSSAVPASHQAAAAPEPLRQLTAEERTARARALRGAVLDAPVRNTPEYDRSQIGPKVTPRSIPNESGAVAPGRLLSQAEQLRQREMEELQKIKEQERSQAVVESRRADERAAQSRAISGQRSGGAQPPNVARGDQARLQMAQRAGDQAATKAVALGLGRDAVRPDDTDEGARRGGKVLPRRSTGAIRERRDDDRGPRTGRLTVTQALSDNDEKTRSVASFRRALNREKLKQQQQGETQKIAREVIIPETITVQDLANRMAERGSDVIKALMKMGVMATITQLIDPDTAELIATEMGHKVKRVTESDIELGLGGDADAAETLLPRPPVVTIMGHVDHGKTSLLDALRKTRVAAGEAGGITQHIGAYQIKVPDGRLVTFIDTPGHAAFSEMRARGANVTDIVVLVVAADDGIMPQTIEAIRHAKAAGVPMVVAINKMDLPGANPRKVREVLLQHDVQVEEMGGEVMNVEVSAKTGLGLDTLLETLLLQAEVLELKANPNRRGVGVVIEAKVEKGRGSVATVLMQRGTVKTGEIFVAGAEWGRVRALINDVGKNVEMAVPAQPIEVLGIQGTPMAGDEFTVVENEARAKEIAEYRARQKRLKQSALQKRGSLEQMMEGLKSGTAKGLPIMIKGDVQGSVEAIRGALLGLTADNTEVQVQVLDAGVGAISESDVTLAAASRGLIIGFNVRANTQARDLAKRDGVEIRYYAIIYEIIDDVKALLSGMLSPELREKTLGQAEILQVFNITKAGKVAGCIVRDGIVKRGARVRLLRDNVVIHDGALKTLKRLKDEVKEVKAGLECGMAFENYDDIQPQDMLEIYEIEKQSRSI